MLASALDDGESGKGSTVLLAGEGGVGKTRLVKALADQATRRGWNVALGRAYPVESGVPYALFSDALLPVLRKLDASALNVLTRGGSAELAYLFPALAPPGERERSAGRENPTEFKARLLWNFAQFLGRFAARQPLLIVLENLQWADASSLELLHFVARQLGAEKIVLLCTYNEAERDLNPTLRGTEQSLVSLGAARMHRLSPLSRAETEELVHRLFGADRTTTREFVALLFGWTRGNPFFIEETLKALVESGKLREREGTWLGWELEGFDLPRSVREAVIARLDRLPPAARQVAELTAVIGTRASHQALRAVCPLPETEVLAALDELRRQRVLTESTVGDDIVYDFAHPLLQDVLYAELGLARARLLHAAVAEALESFYGARALQHADILALHYARAEARAAAPKAIAYLVAAGRHALAHYANREAANYLSAALDHLDRTSEREVDADVQHLVDELAQVRQRLGEYDAAMALWQRARADAAKQGAASRLARIERRMGLACYWSGRYMEALAHYDAGLAAADRAGEDPLRARILIARGMCYQAFGQPQEAKDEVMQGLAIAERLGDQALLSRAHRAMLLLYVWTGPAELAREHGERAREIALATGDRAVAWSAHWGLAVLEGLTSNASEIARHVAAAEQLADELRSPLLRLWTAEVSIEYASGIGDWDAGLALGERSIALARALGQRTLLPRLLFWTGLIYLGRGDLERSKRYFDEAWTLSGAGADAGRPTDVHTVVPAHTGLTHYYVAAGDYRKAIEVGEAGLAIADRTGYVAWAIYRLMPMITEAALWMQDVELAEKYGTRMRRESEQLGHKLGIAWSDCCDALIAMLRRDHDRAVGLLTGAAEALEAVPFTFDAARVRRKLAWVLQETGDREGAMRELRRAHDTFARLGAEQELSITRSLLRDLGARPPVRATTNGAAGLTGRELGIVRLVADRKSNKEIGTALGISPRTVSTHLSNIFAKMSVGSRAELADVARRSGLVER